MGSGGEGEAWRSILKARSLSMLGRHGDAVEEAEWAADTSRARGMLWQLPAALLTLAQARAEIGASGVEEALDEAVAVCRRLGHALTLRRIEAERPALTGART